MQNKIEEIAKKIFLVAHPSWTLEELDEIWNPEKIRHLECIEVAQQIDALYEPTRVKRVRPKRLERLSVKDKLELEAIEFQDRLREKGWT